jgi:hypothetical protein
MFTTMADASSASKMKGATLNEVALFFGSLA